MTYQEFKSGPGRDIAIRLLDLDPADYAGWRAFMIAATNNPKGLGGSDQVTKKALAKIENVFGTVSTGQRAVVLSILYAIDHRALADRLARESDVTYLELLSRTFDSHLDACLACLALKDGPAPLKVVRG